MAMIPGDNHLPMPPGCPVVSPFRPVPVSTGICQPVTCNSTSVGWLKGQFCRKTGSYTLDFLKIISTFFPSGWSTKEGEAAMHRWDLCWCRPCVSNSKKIIHQHPVVLKFLLNQQISSGNQTWVSCQSQTIPWASMGKSWRPLELIEDPRNNGW